MISCSTASVSLRRSAAVQCRAACIVHARALHHQRACARAGSGRRRRGGCISRALRALQGGCTACVHFQYVSTCAWTALKLRNRQSRLQHVLASQVERLHEPVQLMVCDASMAIENAPKRTSLAPCRSPSGPASAVSVWPHRGVLGIPLTGNSRGLGAGSGLSDSSPSMSPRRCQNRSSRWSELGRHCGLQRATKCLRWQDSPFCPATEIAEISAAIRRTAVFLHRSKPSATAVCTQRRVSVSQD